MLIIPSLILFAFGIINLVICLRKKTFTCQQLSNNAILWIILLSINLWFSMTYYSSVEENPHFENSNTSYDTKFLQPLDDAENLVYYEKSGIGTSALELIAVTEPTVLTLTCSYSSDGPEWQYAELKAIYDEDDHYLSVAVDMLPDSANMKNCIYLYPDSSYELSIETSVQDMHWTVTLSTLGNSSSDVFSGTTSTVTPWFSPSSDLYKVTYVGDDYFKVYRYSYHNYNNMYSGFIPIHSVKGPFTGTISFAAGYDNHAFFAIDVRSGEWTIEPVK